MKFYLVDGTFKEGMPKGSAFQEALKAHHAYWAPHMQAGKVLFSGPKTSGAGLLVLKCSDAEEVQKLIEADPFVTRGVAEFEASEFSPFYKFPAAAQWFGE